MLVAMIPLARSSSTSPPSRECHHRGMSYCELCGLDRDQCEHGYADRQAAMARPSPVNLVLVSPTNTAHFPGCPHKGDDGDLSDWGEILITNAWERLGNADTIACT